MYPARIIFVIIVVLALAGGVGYGLYLTAYGVISGFQALDTNLAGVIVAASATVILSVLIITYNQRKIKRWEIAESHRPQKIDLYKRMMDESILNLLWPAQKKTGKSRDNKGSQQRFEESSLNFNGDVVIFGAPRVIRAFIAFWKSDNIKDQVIKLEELLRAIRSDLGISNWGLEYGQLVWLHSSDSDQNERLASAMAMSK